MVPVPVRRKKDEFHGILKFSKTSKKQKKIKLGIFYFYFSNFIYTRVFYNIYHIYLVLPPPLQQLISCLQLGEYWNMSQWLALCPMRRLWKLGKPIYKLLLTYGTTACKRVVVDLLEVPYRTVWGIIKRYEDYEMGKPVVEKLGRPPIVGEHESLLLTVLAVSGCICTDQRYSRELCELEM